MSDIRGVGLDLCEIRRMNSWLEKPTYLNRVFTEQEQAYALSRGATAPSSLAAMWAAKEAFCKALGCGIAFPLTDIEIVHDEGRPSYRLHGEAEKRADGCRAFLSLTHEAGVAGAVCILI